MKILIVEDNLMNVELLVIRLRNLGCESILARTPAEAIEMARTEQPDIILLDLRLETGPTFGVEDLEGIEIFQQLRASTDTSTIPVVVHSIYVRSAADTPVGLPVPDGILTKPFKYQELREIVERFQDLAPTLSEKPEGIVVIARTV